MEALIDKINNTARSIFLLAGIVLVGFYYSSYFNDGSTLDTQIEAIRQETANSERELEAASKVASEKAKFQEEVNVVSEQLKAAFVYLPPTLELQDVIKRISNEVRYSGVNLSKITPLKSETKGFYEEVPVRIEAEGSFQQVATFLAAIARVDRIISIRNLELSRDRVTDFGVSIRMQGQLVAYRYLDENRAGQSPASPK